MKRITINDITIEFDDTVNVEFDGKTLRIAGVPKVENHYHTHAHYDGFQTSLTPITVTAPQITCGQNVIGPFGGTTVSTYYRTAKLSGSPEDGLRQSRGALILACS